MLFFFKRYFSVIFFLLTFIFDLEFILLFTTFLIFHIFYGIKTIISDYIHSIEISSFLTFIFRLIFLFCFNSLLEFIF